MLTTPTRTPTRTTPASPAALLRAIAPVAPEEFLAEHWERTPLHVARGEEGRFDDLLSAREAVRMLEEPGLRVPGFRLVQADATHDPRAYTVDLSWRPKPFTGTAQPGYVVAAFAAGATLVLQGLHLHRAPTAAFCRAARGLPRPPGAAQRLLHAAALAGAARPPRHARRLRPAGRRAASAGSSTTRSGSCR